MSEVFVDENSNVKGSLMVLRNNNNDKQRHILY